MVTPAATLLFPLVPGDVGRRITDLRPKFEDPHLVRDALKVMRTQTASEIEVRSSDGMWYWRRILPFDGGAETRKGITLTFANTTARRNADTVPTTRRTAKRQRAGAAFRSNIVRCPRSRYSPQPSTGSKIDSALAAAR